MSCRLTTALPMATTAVAFPIEVTEAATPLHSLRLIGMPERQGRLTRDRVAAALKTLSPPADCRALVRLELPTVPVHQTPLDLPIAIALLLLQGRIYGHQLQNRLVVGELSFDGRLRPVRGALALAEFAQSHGFRELVVPTANVPEAVALPRLASARTKPGLSIIGVDTLAQAVDHLAGITPIAPSGPPASNSSVGSCQPDLADVRGLEVGKRALEVAASGGHHICLTGPPGSGKTLLARRFPGLLPPLSPSEAVEVTKLHALVAGRPLSGLIQDRPLRSPHMSVSLPGLVGSIANIPRPGEVSLAHRGALFLDDLPDFRRDVLSGLRTILEQGRIVRHQHGRSVEFPARFSLIASKQPCPCGLLHSPRRTCRCTEAAIDRFQRRIPEWLGERFDLHVELSPVGPDDLRGTAGERTAAVATRVAEARRRQVERWRQIDPAATPRVNALLGPADIDRHCHMDDAARRLLDLATERLLLAPRRIHRITTVARTLADLSGAAMLRASHVAEAIQYRYPSGGALPS